MPEFPRLTVVEFHHDGLLAAVRKQMVAGAFGSLVIASLPSATMEVSACATWWQPECLYLPTDEPVHPRAPSVPPVGTLSTLTTASGSTASTVVVAAGFRSPVGLLPPSGLF